jgi:ribosomal protein S18 acetylase RimI-like enzyme
LVRAAAWATLGRVNPELIVRPLERADVPTTAALLARAFHDDPAYAFLFPRPALRRAGLEDLFARNLLTHLPYRCTRVVVEGRAVLGTVTFRPPDGFSISLLTMVRRGLLPYALAHGAKAVRRLLVVKETYDALEARIAGKERHWYVHMMAVDPARQGRALGSRLLEQVLAETTDAGGAGAPPAVLTTHQERNLVFYARAGFETCGTEDVAMLGEPAYRVWGMRRTARGSAD